MYPVKVEVTFNHGICFARSTLTQPNYFTVRSECPITFMTVAMYLQLMVTTKHLTATDEDQVHSWTSVKATLTVEHFTVCPSLRQLHDPTTSIQSKCRISHPTTTTHQWAYIRILLYVRFTVLSPPWRRPEHSGQNVGKVFSPFSGWYRRTLHRSVLCYPNIWQWNSCVCTYIHKGSKFLLYTSNTITLTSTKPLLYNELEM